MIRDIASKLPEPGCSALKKVIEIGDLLLKDFSLLELEEANADLDLDDVWRKAEIARQEVIKDPENKEKAQSLISAYVLADHEARKLMGSINWKLKVVDGEVVLQEQFLNDRYKRYKSIASITSSGWIKISEGSLVSIAQMERLIEKHKRNAK